MRRKRRRRRKEKKRKKKPLKAQVHTIQAGNRCGNTQCSHVRL